MLQLFCTLWAKQYRTENFHQTGFLNQPLDALRVAVTNIEARGELRDH